MSTETGLEGMTRRILEKRFSRRELLKMVPHASILLLATGVGLSELKSKGKSQATLDSSEKPSSESEVSQKFNRAVLNSVERISSFSQEELREKARPWAQEQPQTFSEVIGGFLQAQEEPKGVRRTSWKNLVLLNFILTREKRIPEEWKSLAPEQQEKYWEHVEIMNLILTKLHPTKKDFLKMSNLELGGLLLAIFEDAKKIQEKHGFPPQKPEFPFPLDPREVPREV